MSLQLLLMGSTLSSSTQDAEEYENKHFDHRLLLISSDGEIFGTVVVLHQKQHVDT
jgi:hypothetical protein